MWIYLLQSNLGAAWRSYETVMIEADIASDASRRQYAGVVDFQYGPSLITAGNLNTACYNRISKSKKALH